MSLTYWNFELCAWLHWKQVQHSLTQFVFGIVVPFLFALLILIIGRFQLSYESTKMFPPFCALDRQVWDPVMAFDDCPFVKGSSELKVVYSPVSNALGPTMNKFHIITKEVVAFDNSSVLNEYLKNATDSLFVALEFPDHYSQVDDVEDLKNIIVCIRMKGQWKTHKITETRFRNVENESPRGQIEPPYATHGFLTVQQLLTAFFILTKNKIIEEEKHPDWPMKQYEFSEWFDNNSIPEVQLRRFAHPPERLNRKYTNNFTDDGLQFGLFLNIATFYVFFIVIKSIVKEKESQLKVPMKVMGLSNWMRWLVLFLRALVIVLITSIIFTLALKKQPAVFRYTDSSVIMVFLTLYGCAVVMCAFVLSVLFSKVSTACYISPIVYLTFFGIGMYQHMMCKLKTYNSKVISSIIMNAAVFNGFHIILGLEDIHEGSHWSNLSKNADPEDVFSLRTVFIILATETMVFCLLGFYIEHIYPGENEESQPWYFLCSSKYWRGEKRRLISDNYVSDIKPVNGEFEIEPTYLDVGVMLVGLTKAFGTREVVKKVTLNLYQGQITILLGNSGAGKTATISMLMGLFSPTGGTALIDGYDVLTDRERIGSIGWCPTYNIIFPQLTVYYHLAIVCKLKGLRGLNRQHEVEKYLRLLNLKKQRNTLVSRMPSWLQRKLCIGMAFCGNSKIVLLDEPTNDLNSSSQRDIWRLIKAEKKGRTILVATSCSNEANFLGDRIAIMSEGSLLCCGSSSFLKKQYTDGYILRLYTKPKCNINYITEYLRKQTLDVQLESCIGAEISYLVKETEARVLEDMLADLEHNDALGIQSYSISPSTMEDVAQKVVAQRILHTNKLYQENPYRTEYNSPEDKPAKGPSYVPLKQLHAMLMKMIFYAVSCWKFILIQIVIVIALPTLLLEGTNPNPKLVSISDLLPLNLDKFENPIVLLQQDNDWSEWYRKALGDSVRVESTNRLSARVVTYMEEEPKFFARYYPVGASFRKSYSGLTRAVAWFDAAQYHGPAISLALVLNAVFKGATQCSNCSIEFVNYPIEQQKLEAAALELTSLKEAYSTSVIRAVTITLAFILPFYSFQCIKEKVSGFMYLQFSSGADVFVYWLTFYIGSLTHYIFLALYMVIIIGNYHLVAFQTFNELAMLFFLIFMYGLANFPIIFIMGRLIFKTQSAAYCIMLSIFVFLSFFSLYAEPILTKGKNIGEAVLPKTNGNFQVCNLLPYFNLPAALANMGDYKLFKDTCKEMAPIQNFSAELTKMEQKRARLCQEFAISQMELAPGIGQNIVLFAITAILGFIILLLIDYPWMSYFRNAIKKADSVEEYEFIKNVDKSVIDEKQIILDTPWDKLMSNYAIVLINLTKGFWKCKDINHLYLTTTKGECFGLMGLPGAGKTTTVKMMSGLLKIWQGDCFVLGHSISKQPWRVHRNVGCFLHSDALMDELTPRQLLMIFALIKGVRVEATKSVVENLAKELDFFQHLDNRIKRLSGGTKGKVTLAISFVCNPPVVYLIEPTKDMDAATRKFCWNAIAKYRDVGNTIFLTSQCMEECQALCARVAIMVDGSLMCLGSLEQIKNTFANGYTLIIKGEAESPGHIYSFVEGNFPNADLVEKHENLYTFQIPDSSIPCSKIFGIMQKSKGMNRTIADYSIGQCTLEQAFTLHPEKRPLYDDDDDDDSW